MTTVVFAEREKPVEASNSEAPTRDVVDPLIRAHIYSLCTALGGSSVETTGKYALGDDALAVLKDLRRWLKLYDEKLNRYDVARCLSEAQLLQNDLLEIIALWKDDETHIKPKHRLVLACIELIAPLTWPLEKHADDMTVNHHRHLPVLQFTQASYKAALLRHRGGKGLRDIIRAGLPSMALPVIDRTERDEGIIKLILFVIRNLAMIEHPMPTENDTGEEINRSATVNCFKEQNVLDLILTISSGIGDEFRQQDGVVMEAIYHLVKGVDPESLFRGEAEAAEAAGRDLSSLLKKEDAMNRSRTGPTRHNRFGTSLWVQRTDGTRSFVSGQDALLGKTTGMDKMDSSKVHRRPRGWDRQGTSKKTEFDMVVRLDTQARQNLKWFVEEFIDAGFNPLFLAIRKAIDRDVERLLDTHARMYFYLVAWFLKAEKMRRRAAAKERRKRGEKAAEDSFSVVAAVLNHEFLGTMTRKMDSWHDTKQWTQLQAGMRAFTQVLYTVQDMALSSIEEDQEIAENIQSRIFYEEAIMDLVYNVCKAYTVQPFRITEMDMILTKDRWLDDCTEMVHVHLKLLEKYSQQHEHMFVRSRRRQIRKKKADQAENGIDSDEEPAQDLTAEELAAAARRANSERAFDFTRFEAKYMNERCLNTFISFLGFYRELDTNQIMRSVKMLHRIFVKRGMEVLLYRLDLVDLLNRMMNSDKALPRSHAAYKEVDAFAKHYLRKLFKKLEQEPALYVELLFSKMNSTIHFMQYGYDKEAHVSKPRAAAELEIKKGTALSAAEQVGVVVGAMLDGEKSGLVEWIKDVLRKAATERKSFEAEAEARALLEAEGRDPDAPAGPETEKPTPPNFSIVPDNDERKTAMFKDGLLRLLLRQLGAEPIEINEALGTPWVFPSHLPASTLQESLTSLQNAANDPPSFENDTKASDFIRRKLLPRTNTRAELSSESEGSAGSDTEHEFEADDPERLIPAGDKQPKIKRKKRVKAIGEIEVVKEKKRKEKEDRRIRSEKFVSLSDDESGDDAEFFEREKKLREMTDRLARGEHVPELEAARERVAREEGGKKRRRGQGDKGGAKGGGRGRKVFLGRVRVRRR
ncbi:Similar to Topoisomerase 1-associated factor 1; acc. no. A1C928 [Pyronema omphalodes CBS 100304]|uniref:Topoisomerase 1-associated factor 1 n=1 Tax=Pyronema omphalodes (strain CBS 100304) TaxID=1076935 RepID=U4LKT4_PYROM|nr:Similar to Topoisomerase 1-associated factor 1; acc. no. A1C928 [Pyronema omphalodes CBS 100304]